MIIGYFGDLGSGKTLSMVKMLHTLWERGYTIHTNVGVSFPHKPLEIDYMIDIVEGNATIEDKSVFAIDEMAVYMDSRNLTKTNKIISYLLLQTRKLNSQETGLYFLYTTQFPRLIDVRLWLVTAIKIVCTKNQFGEYTIINETWIIDRIQSSNVFYESFVANFYFQYYDTKQIIKIPKSKYDK